jgi:hypothetical protein
MTKGETSNIESKELAPADEGGYGWEHRKKK